jgi:hypothetical protein
LHVIREFFEAEIDLLRLIYQACQVAKIGLWSQKHKINLGKKFKQNILGVSLATLQAA